MKTEQSLTGLVRRDIRGKLCAFMAMIGKKHSF